LGGPTRHPVGTARPADRGSAVPRPNDLPGYLSMADLIFIVLPVVVFAVIGLAAKGAERL
jgi:hypothetical protein